MTLYGFSSTDERELFDLLTGVTGVGPKVGLAFLSASQPDALRRAVVAGDADTLTVVPGVGKKVAQRVVLDLRDKLGGEGAEVIRSGPLADVRRPARARAHAGRGLAGHGRDRSRGQGARRPPPRGPAEGGTMTVMPGTDLPADPFDERLIEADALSPEDREFDVALRPRSLDDFVGQDRVKEQLKVLLEGASQRDEPVDHLLFSGPPGLGKTTLAQIVALEMGAGFQPTSGPALERPSDLAAILTNLGDGDVLFVDEIHRMPRAVEEVLYPALEDYSLDVVLGRGRRPARSAWTCRGSP